VDDCALTLEEVCKELGDTQAVDNLTARVPRGMIYGILGPNGAGKTTTLRMIMDIIRPDTGRLRVLGRTPGGETRELVGYMPEERGLYPRMRVSRMLGYLGELKSMPKRVLNQRIPALLERVGLGGWAENRVDELSRGMHQKLQFLATVINDPELLILDEPFSGLDPVNLDLLKDFLLDIRAQGKTIILSTHVMQQAEELCDSILLIHKGRKVLDGPLDEVQEGYRSNVVSVELEGDGSFIEALPMVQETVPVRGRLEVALQDGADTQDFLKALVERARVRAFEIKVPSLHEVFILATGDNDA